MDVVLPDTGCNILRDSNSFYNYSSDGHTREDYQIFDGVAHKNGSHYSSYGYEYSGTCLQTGGI